MLPRKQVNLYFSFLPEILVPITNCTGILAAVKSNNVSLLKAIFNSFHIIFCNGKC